VVFEYDPKKSAANLVKHGIDFETAKKLWDGKVVAGRAKSEGEPRLLAVGRIGGKFWSVIITFRRGNIRIISARRSQKHEIKNYERHQGDDR